MSADGSGRILQGEHRIELDPSSRVLLWHEGKPIFSQLKTVHAEHVSYTKACLRIAWESVLALPATWINARADRDRIGADKILQAQLANEVGLSTIPTVLTNSESAFAAAIAEISTSYIALKSPVQWHSDQVDSTQHVATYTRMFAKSEALGLVKKIGAAPLYVQPYIEKAFELRVTVVEDDVFACKIDSQASPASRIDWRHYDLKNVAHEKHLLPDYVTRSILALRGKCGLVYAAMDFIVEPGGTYRFVEINPSGQYGWIEALCGLPISDAIAERLMRY